MTLLILSIWLKSWDWNLSKTFVMNLLRFLPHDVSKLWWVSKCGASFVGAVEHTKKVVQTALTNNLLNSDCALVSQKEALMAERILSVVVFITYLPEGSRQKGIPCLVHHWDTVFISFTFTKERFWHTVRIRKKAYNIWMPRSKYSLSDEWWIQFWKVKWWECYLHKK